MCVCVCVCVCTLLVVQSVTDMLNVEKKRYKIKIFLSSLLVLNCFSESRSRQNYDHHFVIFLEARVLIACCIWNHKHCHLGQNFRPDLDPNSGFKINVHT